MNCLACTIVTKSHLAYARTLAKTLRQHNHGSRLFVLLADRLEEYFDPAKEPFELVRLSDLNDPEIIEHMCFYYRPFELCCALRGLLHEYMMKEVNAPKWFFFDADIMIFNSLESIWRQLDAASILLCPHFSNPVPDQYVEQYEIDVLRLGLFNGGVIGLRHTKETYRFIEWFKKRLECYAFQKPSQGQYVDQLWLNFVPIFFKNIETIVHSGANLAYWNIHERSLENRSDGQIQVNGQPLLFVHFSGWQFDRPEVLSRWAGMDERNIHHSIAQLGEKYRDLLLENGHETVRNTACAFSCFKNGELISDNMRHLHFEDLMTGSACSGSPFDNYSYFQSRLKNIK
jgi:hypothetical protein